MKLLVIALGMIGFAGTVLASEVSVSCSRTQKKWDGEKLLGVQVHNLDLAYEQNSWFGSNPGYQKIALDVCVTVID